MFLFQGTEVFFWTPYSARGCFSNTKIPSPLCNLLNTAPALLSGFCSREYLLCNPELPCHSFSNFGIGILANIKTILVIPVLLRQNLAKGERRRGPGTMCLPTPWRTGLCCLLVQNNQCPCYPHGFYLMFKDLLVRNSAQQKKGTDYAINIVSYLTCKSPKISQHHTTYTTYSFHPHKCLSTLC